MKKSSVRHKKSKSNYVSVYRQLRQKGNVEFSKNQPSQTALSAHFSVTGYDEKSIVEKNFSSLDTLLATYSESAKNTTNCLIDIAGASVEDIRKAAQYFQLHHLVVRDIIADIEHAKTDDLDNYVYVHLPQLSYCIESNSVKVEQLFLILSEHYLLSIHHCDTPAYQDIIKEKLNHPDSPLRTKTQDYLLYVLLDIVVSDYFKVADKLSEQIDELENAVFDYPDKSILLRIAIERHSLMVVKRAITPVRSLLNDLRQSDNKAISTASQRFFKGVFEHISLAVEQNESQREALINIQQLYMNQVNTRMNEVVKILTIVTTVLAPFTVISGIYGMNFSHIPFSEVPFGFWAAVILMVLITVSMLFYFRKKGWF